MGLSTPHRPMSPSRVHSQAAGCFPGRIPGQTKPQHAALPPCRTLPSRASDGSLRRGARDEAELEMGCAPRDHTHPNAATPTPTRPHPHPCGNTHQPIPWEAGQKRESHATTRWARQSSQYLRLLSCSWGILKMPEKLKATYKSFTNRTWNTLWKKLYYHRKISKLYTKDIKYQS